MCQQRVPFIARRILLPPSARRSPPGGPPMSPPPLGLLAKTTAKKGNRPNRATKVRFGVDIFQQPRINCRRKTETYLAHLANPLRCCVSCLLMEKCKNYATPTWKRGWVQFKKEIRNRSNPFHAADKIFRLSHSGEREFCASLRVRVRLLFFLFFLRKLQLFAPKCLFFASLTPATPTRPRRKKNSSGTVATVRASVRPSPPDRRGGGLDDHESIYIPTW